MSYTLHMGGTVDQRHNGLTWEGYRVSNQQIDGGNYRLAYQMLAGAIGQIRSWETKGIEEEQAMILPLAFLVMGIEAQTKLAERVNDGSKAMKILRQGVGLVRALGPVAKAQLGETQDVRLRGLTQDIYAAMARGLLAQFEITGDRNLLRSARDGFQRALDWQVVKPENRRTGANMLSDRYEGEGDEGLYPEGEEAEPRGRDVIADKIMSVVKDAANRTPLHGLAAPPLEVKYEAKRNRLWIELRTVMMRDLDTHKRANMLWQIWQDVSRDFQTQKYDVRAAGLMLESVEEVLNMCGETSEGFWPLLKHKWQNLHHQARQTGQIAEPDFEKWYRERMKRQKHAAGKKKMRQWSYRVLHG